MFPLLEGTFQGTIISKGEIKEYTTSYNILIEGKKSKNKGGLKVLAPMYIYDENERYTEEILNIFNYKEKEYEKTTNISK